MGGDLIDGAILTVVGMGVVFAVLAILAQISRLLSRVFGEKGEGPVPTAPGIESIVTEEGKAPAEGDVVAAIALALSLAQSETGKLVPEEGAPRKREPSPWIAYGRQQLMESRGRTRKKW